MIFTPGNEAEIDVVVMRIEERTHFLSLPCVSNVVFLSVEVINVEVGELSLRGIGIKPLHVIFFIFTLYV